MNDFPSASELVESLINSDGYNSILERIKEKLQENAKEGLHSCNFYLSFEEQFMYEKLHDFLVGKGYKVSWNGACLWMEITW